MPAVNTVKDQAAQRIVNILADLTEATIDPGEAFRIAYNAIEEAEESARKEGK